MEFVLVRSLEQLTFCFFLWSSSYFSKHCFPFAWLHQFRRKKNKEKRTKSACERAQSNAKGKQKYLWQIPVFCVFWKGSWRELHIKSATVYRRWRAPHSQNGQFSRPFSTWHQLRALVAECFFSDVVVAWLSLPSRQGASTMSMARKREARTCTFGHSTRVPGGGSCSSTKQKKKMAFDKATMQFTE